MKKSEDKKEIVTKSISSDFSRFFRDASTAQKEAVFIEVARKAAADQKEVIDAIHQSIPRAV